MAASPGSANGADVLARAKALYGQLTPATTLQARELLEGLLGNAIGLAKPVLVESQALLADILACDYLNRWNGADAAHLAQAERLAGEALTADPALPLAHYAHGFICRAKGEHEKALAAYARTTELDPGFIRAYAMQAAQLLYLGRLDEVAALVDTAIARTPPGNLSLGMFYWILGRSHFYAARYDEAIAWLRRSVEIRPNLWYNRLYQASAHALNGEIEVARQVLRDFDALFPGYTVARVMQHEDAAPKHHPVLVEGKHRFHQGLRAAGMNEV